MLMWVREYLRIHRTSGYVGMADHVIPVSDAGDKAAISDINVGNIKLRPADLGIEIKRKYTTLGSSNVLVGEGYVGPGGVALATDRSITVQMGFALRDGEERTIQLPNEVAGYKGRVLVMSEANIAKDVGRFDIRPGMETVKVDIASLEGASHSLLNYVIDVDPDGANPTFKGRNTQEEIDKLNAADTTGTDYSNNTDLTLDRFVQIGHTISRLVPDDQHASVTSAMNEKRCWTKSEFDSTFPYAATSSGLLATARICAREAIYSVYGFEAKELKVYHEGNTDSTTYSGSNGGEVPAIGATDESFDLFYEFFYPYDREYGADGQDRLFIMKFNDGMAEGQLKGIKQDGNGNWFLCDLDANNAPINCVSLDTQNAQTSFALAGISLDELLFIELYLKNDPGNTLWKWYLNLDMEFMYLTVDGSRSNIFVPTDGADPAKHRLLMVNANGALGKNIAVSVAVKDGAGNLTVPPNPDDYPPASLELPMVRMSDDPAHVNYDYYVLENEAPLIVTSGTLASIDPNYSGLVLYDPPEEYVVFGAANDWLAALDRSVDVMEARAGIHMPTVTVDVLYDDGMVVENADSFVLRWENQVPPRHGTQFRVWVSGLYPTQGAEAYYVEIDGGEGPAAFGTARSVGEPEPAWLLPVAGTGGFVGQAIISLPTAPGNLRGYVPGLGGNGCSVGGATTHEDCIRPFRARIRVVYVSDWTSFEAQKNREYIVENFVIEQSLEDTVVQEYWDHYPYTDPRYNPRRIHCVSGSAQIGQGRLADGTCYGANVHPWPTDETFVDPVMTTNYTLDQGCGGDGTVGCRDRISGNYADVNGRWLTRGHPLGYAEEIRTRYIADVRQTGAIAPADDDVTQRVTSGWRNPERNEREGGVINSTHQWGDALDMTPENRTPEPGVRNGIAAVHDPDNPDLAPQSWCQLAASAHTLNGDRSLEINIENRRRNKPAGTPNFYYYYQLGRSEVEVPACNTLTGQQKCECYVRAHTETCLAQPFPLNEDDDPNNDVNPNVVCSPDHVHSARR